MLTRGTMREHQAQGFEFAINRRDTLLDMFMSTGKSKLTVDLIQNWQAGPTLIVCPKSVKGVWLREFDDWSCLDHKVLVLQDNWSTKKRAEKAAEWYQLHRNLAVIVNNYESVWRKPFNSFIHSHRWGVIACDESHRIKSHNSKVSQFLSRVKSEKRLCGSGTVFFHSPLCIFGQARFLDPSYFGFSWHRFQSHYAVLKKIPDVPVPIVINYQNEDELTQIYGGFSHFTGKEALDLMPSQHIDIEVKLSPKGRRVYGEVAEHFISEVENGYVTAANIMVKQLRLQQITSGAVPFKNLETKEKGFEVIDSSKEDTLCDMVADIDRDESVVVFGRFKSDMLAVERVARRLGRQHTELSGRARDITERSEMLPIPGQLMGVNVRSGGVGIDLTQARIFFFFSISHTPGDFDQCVYRGNRTNQTRSMTFYHLVARSTIDRVIYRAVRNGRKVIDEIFKEVRECPQQMAKAC